MFVKKRIWLSWITLLILFAGVGVWAQADSDDEGVIGEAVYIGGDDDGGVVEETAVSPHLPDADQFVYLPIITKPSTLSKEGQEVLDLVNSERAKAGCSPVQAQAQLTAAAQKHSEDMATQKYFSHNSLDGRSPWDRIRAEGYTYSQAGENIAMGYSTATAVMNGWMNSSGHRANILNCSFTEIGIGYDQRYWTQDFARPQ